MGDYIIDGLGEGNAVGVTDSNRLMTEILNSDFLIEVQVDSVDSNIEYIGTAEIGSLTSSAVWKIKRVDYTNGTIIKYADSNGNFDNIFDDRESLTYG